MRALFALPFNDLLFHAQSVHRQNFDPNAVQCSTLLSIKTARLTTDPDGHLKGEAVLNIRDPAAALLSLGAVGVLPTDTAAAITALGPAGAPKALDFALSFRDGRTWVAGLPVGPAPDLY